MVEGALREAGWTVVSDPAEADLVVVSFDRSFDYAKLEAAYRAVRHARRRRSSPPTPIPYCPTPDGGLPDCAAMLAAIEACTGASAEAVLGKPSRAMARRCWSGSAPSPRAAALVGDRLATDVAMGQRLGMAGVLVLSGATAAAA